MFVIVTPHLRYSCLFRLRPTPYHPRRPRYHRPTENQSGQILDLGYG